MQEEILFKTHEIGKGEKYDLTLSDNDFGGIMFHFFSRSDKTNTLGVSIEPGQEQSVNIVLCNAPDNSYIDSPIMEIGTNNENNKRLFLELRIAPIHENGKRKWGIRFTKD